MAASDKPSACVLYDMGADYAPAIAKRGHIHRFFLPMFLHDGFLHILFNVWSFWVFGFKVEKDLGLGLKPKIFYILILFISHFCGSLMSALFAPNSLSVGFSAAIYGLFAIFVVWFFMHFRQLGGFKNIFTIIILIMIVLMVVSLITPSDKVNAFGHLGGLFAGIMIAPLANKNDTEVSAVKWKRCQLGGLIILTVYLIVFTIVMFARKYGCESYNCAFICWV